MSRSHAGRSRRIPALLVVLAGLCGWSGCGDDGSGDRQGLIGLPEAGTPEQAWQHIERSLNEHNADGWANSLGATFEYVPDPVSAAEFPGAWASWDREVEVAFVGAFLAADLELDADLVVDDSACPNPSGNTVTWPDVEYSVVVSGSGGATPVTYRGFADLEFILDGGLWYLRRWVDLGGAPAPWNENVICPTFGELRAAYREW